MLKTTALALSLTLLATVPVSAQLVPPPTVVVDGACPFECCTYGQWLTLRTTDLHSDPDSASAVVGQVERGDTVIAETGQVRTAPAPFRVASAMTLGPAVGPSFVPTRVDVQPGDTVWLLDYVGEGIFNVWRDGQTLSAVLDFSPFGGASRSRLGELLREPESIWWARIRTSSGATGWTSATDAFGGKDACAC